MNRLLIIMFSVISFSEVANAQVKVANYSTGQYGTENYEHLSFWVTGKKRSHIEYSYGTKPKEIRLAILGKATLKNKEYLQVQFPNKHILYITRNGNKLTVRDEKEKYLKTFVWAYEGPVEGIGTDCNVCAKNEHEAIQIVTNQYLK